MEIRLTYLQATRQGLNREYIKTSVYNWNSVARNCAESC